MIGICLLDLDVNHRNPAPLAACEPAVNSSIASRTEKQPPARATSQVEEDQELWLSESSGIRLAKTGKVAGLQWSKTLDISSRNRKPWKGWD